ncbi:uncharacterized transporter slc-17.2-like isoform X2 [Artemia franciscana]|uniref:uncharacterized transporter slc-17.2-like isoform X2 n=1 Tax=Artemia franciscana TaxID=6661 RepID=UPI0032D9E6E5
MTLPDCGSRKSKLFPSCRMTLALVIMMGTFVLFHLRINLNFAVVCMVKEKPLNNTLRSTSNHICRHLNATVTNETIMEDHIIIGELEWDKELQALVLGSVYWGFATTQVVGGFFTDRYGSIKKILLLGMGLYSGLTFFIPLAARWNVGALIALRVVQGFCSGLTLPCFSVLFRRWTTREERSTLMSIGYSGYNIASVITFPISGLLCEHGFGGGWPSIFYVGGIIGIGWCCIVVIFVYDSPDSHPRITYEEKEFFQKYSHVDFKSKKASSYKELCQLFGSPAILAFIITQYATLWGFYSLIVNLPMYMKEVLDFDIADNGLFSAAPYVFSLVIHYICGPMCDWLTTKNLCSLTVQRKIFTAFGTLVPALMMFCIGLFDCESRGSILILLSISTAMSELAFVGGYHYSVLDVAPDYAGVVTGVSNTIATSSGFVSPALVALLTPNGTREEWLIVFYITGAVYIMGASVYAIFGTSEALDLTQRKFATVDPDVALPLKPNNK